MRTKILIIGAVVLTLISSSVLAQSDYTHGNGALELFDSEGFAASPAWVRYWIFFMLAMFASGLFFVWKQPIARWVVGGFILGGVAMALAGSVFGVPPISGFIAIMHIIFWSPGLYQLLSKRPFAKPTSAFSIWSGMMTMTILFSFIFDFRDAAIYLMHLVG